MLHISLFSGIGGFDLASDCMGWENIVSCDINEFGNKILAYYWPNAYHHKDIKTLTYDTINTELTRRFGTNWRDDEIIVTGGFPCQPFSLAGKRKGTEDDRHLWPEMLRVIREIKPTWVVGENVFGIVNWDGGMVFEQVQTDLEAEGYEVQPYILPACGVNAPHKRDRIWFVAHSESDRNRGRLLRMETENDRIRKPEKYGKNNVQFGNDGKKRTSSDPRLLGSQERQFESMGIEQLREEQSFTDTEGEQSERLRFEQREFSQQRQREFRGINSAMGCGDAANPRDTRLQRSEKFRSIASEWPEWDKQPAGRICTDWQNFPTQSPICHGNDGFSNRLVGVTFPKWRNESIKAMGNAVVPQVVYQIFKTIERYNNL